MTEKNLHCQREQSEWSCPEESNISQEAKDLATALWSNDAFRPDGEALAHAWRMVKNAVLFARGKRDEVPPALAEAALLHDLFGRMTRQKEGIIDPGLEEKIKQYCDGGRNDPNRRRVMDIMHDQVVIGEAARAYRRDVQLFTDDTETVRSGGEFVFALNHHEYDGALSPESWKTVAPKIHWEEMAELTKKVHIEALIIKGAEMIDNLKYPAPREAAQLHDILETESFYIPLLEVLGYDAMAMELANTCKILRLKGQGKTDALDEATALYRQAANIDPSNVAQTIFGLENAPEINWVINETSDDIEAGLNCRMGEFVIEQENRPPLRMKFRQKSIGSLAHKLATTDADYRPMDVYGFVIITGDEPFGNVRYHNLTVEDTRRIHQEQLDRLGACFPKLVARASESSQLNFCSPEKTRKPVYMQGGEEFVATVQKNELPEGQCEARILAGSNVYQVAKYMALYHNDEGDVTPIEVQILTGFDHQLAKIGKTSHAIYKSGHKGAFTDEKLTEILNYINAMHERKDFFGHHIGNKFSQKIGKQAVKALLRGAYPEFARTRQTA